MKIIITKCSWNKKLEGKEMEIKQTKSKQPKYPPWFAYFVEHEFKPLKKMVIKHDKMLMEHDKLLKDIIRLNNLKTHE